MRRRTTMTTALTIAVVAVLWFLTAGTPTAAAVALSLDLSEVLAAQGRELPRLRSLLVSVDGEIVEEHYFNGATARRVANLKSASKSIISILVGIAIDRGYVTGVDQAIADFFGDELHNADAVKHTITVEDLLTMRSGLETTSNRNYGRWVQSRHWVRHVLTRPMVDAPGGRMVYSTGSTHLLSAIVTRASGMSTLEFGRRYLARPLGITLPVWMRDPQGIYFGGNEMQMTPRDMVAIGELYRRGGAIDGLEIVSAQWIRASLVPRTRSRWSGSSTCACRTRPTGRPKRRATSWSNF